MQAAALAKSSSELRASLLETRNKLIGDLSRLTAPNSARLHLTLPAVILTYKTKEAPSYKLPELTYKQQRISHTEQSVQQQAEARLRDV